MDNSSCLSDASGLQRVQHGNGRGCHRTKAGWCRRKCWWVFRDELSKGQMVLRFYSLWLWILKVSRRGISHGFCSSANPPLQPAFHGEAKATALAGGAHRLTQQSYLSCPAIAGGSPWQVPPALQLLKKVPQKGVLAKPRGKVILSGCTLPGLA